MSATYWHAPVTFSGRPARNRDAHSLDVARGLHRAHRRFLCEAIVPAASLIAATMAV